MINAAIAGLGRWGQILVNSVQSGGTPKGDKIRILRGVARTPDRSAAFCKAQSLALTTNFADILTDDSIDAVILATPHSLHKDQICQAAAAGKHVFCEKPLALTAADARVAVAACQDAKRVLAVGQNRRFLPLIRDLKQMIDRGDLGTILHAEGNFSTEHGLAYDGANWRANDDESPAGAMTASGIHIFDSFIHLLGSIDHVRSITRRRILDVPLDDTTACLLEFSSGALGYLGTMPATPRFFRIHIFGTKGWAQMQLDDELELRFVNEEPRRKSYPAIDMERAELEAFADAIEHGASFPVPIDEVVHGIAFQDALIRSCAQNGDRIAVT